MPKEFPATCRSVFDSSIDAPKTPTQPSISLTLNPRRFKKMLRRFIPIVVALTLSVCAAQSFAESEYNLGVAAYKSKDYASARVHWSRSVEQGELSALNNLGYLLFYGLGGPVDWDHALELWRKSAMRGHSEAQWHLGHVYENGDAVPKNLVEAYAWYRCAVTSAEAAPRDDDAEAQIASDARKSLIQLLEILPPEQFAAAETLAKRRIAAYAAKAGT
jgi:hypothetical protein